MATILIVDDNSTVQRVLTQTLRNAGHDVISVYNGVEALAFLATQSVDLAIVDIAMPEMDGLTLLQELRAIDQFHALPIIMLTASGQDEDYVLAKQRGANAFLTKPTSSRELLDTVHYHLAKP